MSLNATFFYWTNSPKLKDLKFTEKNNNLKPQILFNTTYIFIVC